MKRSAIVMTALLFAGVMSAPALAKNYKASGTIEFNMLSSTPVGGSGEIRRQQYQGVWNVTDGASPVAGTTVTCTGAYKMDSGGAQTSGAGYCDTVDADGDVWVAHWTTGPEDGKWTVTWGTGKFEGMKGSGTTHSIPGPADDITWKGSWTMK